MQIKLTTALLITSSLSIPFANSALIGMSATGKTSFSSSHVETRSFMLPPAQQKFSKSEPTILSLRNTGAVGVQHGSSVVPELTVITLLLQKTNTPPTIIYALATAITTKTQQRKQRSLTI